MKWLLGNQSWLPPPNKLPSKHTSLNPPIFLLHLTCWVRTRAGLSWVTVMLHVALTTNVTWWYTAGRGLVLRTWDTFTHMYRPWWGWSVVWAQLGLSIKGPVSGFNFCQCQRCVLLTQHLGLPEGLLEDTGSGLWHASLLPYDAGQCNDSPARLQGRGRRSPLSGGASRNFLEIQSTVLYPESSYFLAYLTVPKSFSNNIEFKKFVVLPGYFQKKQRI